MDPIIEKLRGQLEELSLANQALLAQADAEGRELSDDENESLDANAADFERIKVSIERRERIVAQTASLDDSQGRRTTGDVPDAGATAPVAGARAYQQPRRADARRDGFAHLGEFAQNVYRAAMQPGSIDQRLLIRGAGMTEGVNQDGGYLVPPDFRDIIVEKVMGEDTLLGRTDGLTTSSNSITVPTDEVEQWDETNGVQATWEGEATSGTYTKAQFDQTQVRLYKLIALVRVSEELLDDSTALESYLRRKVPAKLDYKVNMGLVHGTGTGMPLGILNSNFKVEAASSTAAASVVLYEDILKMWSTMYATYRTNAIWMIHPQVEEYLNAMAFDSGATSKVPVYMPANGLSVSPYATLMGRPVRPSQVCAAPSDPGDIILADWGQYLSVTKSTGVRSDASIHVFFDSDQTAFRFILRVGGTPWFKAPITSRVGSFEQSGFVTLADRT